MKNINNEHIDDGFLKKLVKQTREETPSADFTSRVMASIPQNMPLVEQVEKSALKPWHWIFIGLGFAGIVWFIFTFDFGSFFGIGNANTPGEQVDYLRIFSSALQIFSQAFSAFKLTNISLMVVISMVALYFGDRFLKNRSAEANQNFA